MPKKNMTPEEKKAWGAKMKAAREVKKAAPSPNPSPEINNEDYATLLRRVQELEAREPSSQSPQVTSAGVVGTIEKYVTSPETYPDPRERLAAERRLATFAFPLNYELNWNIGVTSYQTIDGIRMKEPKFNLDLIGIVFDEDGEPTNKRYIMRRLVFFEDPDAAITVARHNGVAVDETNQKSFLDEMRYLRMRDWLLEVFFPPKPQADLKKREEVIGNRLVEVFEVSAETPQSIPFGQLNKKL